MDIGAEIRFWSKVRIRRFGCWEWTGTKASNAGYGCLSVDGRLLRAHRVSYELNIGPIPSGLFVCHSCDNPNCVRPSHLFAGTNADNMRDAFLKGRVRLPHLYHKGQNAGSKHGLSKLTEGDVAEILRRKRDGESQRRLAAEYGVVESVVSMIVTGKRWRHVNAALGT